MTRPLRPLQRQFAEGLEALGFERVQQRAARLVYRRTGPDAGSYWYVGKAGSVRIGKTVATSIPVTPLTKQYLLTAPTLRPLIRGYLAALTVDARSVDIKALTWQLIADHAELQPFAPRIVLSHVNRWAKDQRQESNDDDI
jgi:hypothetical protein